MEKGESLTFNVINSTDQTISFIKSRSVGFDKKDTIRLDDNEKISDVSYEDTGNAIPVPFISYDTIIIVFNDVIYSYTPQTEGKNPFKIEYYLEISRTQPKYYMTEVIYEYLIEPEDFESKSD
ncbi:MAG: hypothetical protein JW798_06835 [Prolixibacteraceae bacterium]|nr:hypothetical protein [Prolixibacteraceae bacterium]